VTPPALVQGPGTEKRSRELRECAEAQQQSLVSRKEEAALVVAAQSGDAHAFEILIERYQRRLLAVARRFTRIREDAEDIVQQSLQKAFIHLHKFEGKSSFSTWLTRIAINEALMLLRRGRRLCEVSIDDLNGKQESALRREMTDSRPGPENTFLQSEQNRVLAAAMNGLKPGTRKAIELRELGELSMEQAARVMGLSVGAVKARVFHGRRKLHQVLKRESVWLYRKPILRVNRKANGYAHHQLVCGSGD
jgi:RNA polymerase sigma-70 factor (ECF subfamily)